METRFHTFKSKQILCPQIINIDNQYLIVGEPLIQIVRRQKARMEEIDYDSHNAKENCQRNCTQFLYFVSAQQQQKVSVILPLKNSFFPFEWWRDDTLVL